MTFVVGDIVRLRSGGPPMTVWGIDPRGDVHVVWFPKDDEPPLRDVFAPVELIPEPP